MRRVAWLLPAALALASPASAQRLLAPDEGDAYRDLLRGVFTEAHGGDAVLSATIMPNSAPEKAVMLIRPRRGGASILVLEPRVHLWRYQLIAMMETGEVRRIDDPSDKQTQKELRELRRGLPKDPTDVRLERCERRLPSRIAPQIEEAWRVMLEETGIEQDPDARIYFHATTYAFAQRNVEGEKRGWIYGGHTGRVRRLIALAHGMDDYCQGKKSSDDLRELAARISVEEAPNPLPSATD
jgi:hypothetical protein